MLVHIFNTPGDIFEKFRGPDTVSGTPRCPLKGGPDIACDSDSTPQTGAERGKALVEYILYKSLSYLAGPSFFWYDND